METPLRDYVKHRVEPAVCEIDQIGLVALVDLLCKPAGIAVEVLYLDRSPGNDPSEIDSYRWDPVDQNTIPLVNPPTIRLLYRP
jgi:ubiquitin thioesterase protein OTUB1